MQTTGVDQSEAILYQLMEIGEILLTSGAEVNRVEDTLTRMGKAHGAERMNVFVITSSVIVTMIFTDGKELTQNRRIMSRWFPVWRSALGIAIGMSLIYAIYQMRRNIRERYQ